MNTKKTSHPPIPLEEPTVAMEDFESATHPKTDMALKKKSPTSPFLALLSVFTLTWLLYFLIATMVNAWKVSAWIGLPLSAITILLLLYVTTKAFRERRNYKAIANIQDNHIHLQRAIEKNDLVATKAILETRLKPIQNKHPERTAQFRHAVMEMDDARDYCNLLENKLLKTIDKEVDAAIQRATITAATTIAISPHPAIDSLLALYHANRLIGEIARQYGLETSFFTCNVLIKEILISMASAATVETLGSIVLENLIKNTLTGQAIKLTAESAIAAGRMYRLGRIAKQYLRPLQ